MKTKLLTSLALFLFAITSLGLSQYSETTMQDIVQSVSDKVTYLEDNGNKEIVNITIDLLVGLKGEKKIYRYLDNSFDYTVLGIYDRRISGLKIEINKLSGKEWVPVKTIKGKNPTTNIYPVTREMYEFIISVDSFKGDNTAGHFAVFIYHDDPSKK